MPAACGKDTRTHEKAQFGRSTSSLRSCQARRGARAKRAMAMAAEGALRWLMVRVILLPEGKGGPAGFSTPRSCTGWRVLRGRSTAGPERQKAGLPTRGDRPCRHEKDLPPIPRRKLPAGPSGRGRTGRQRGKGGRVHGLRGLGCILAAWWGESACTRPHAPPRGRRSMSMKGSRSLHLPVVLSHVSTSFLFRPVCAGPPSPCRGWPGRSAALLRPTGPEILNLFLRSFSQGVDGLRLHPCFPLALASRVSRGRSHAAFSRAASAFTESSSGATPGSGSSPMEA